MSRGRLKACPYPLHCPLSTCGVTILSTPCNHLYFSPQPFWGTATNWSIKSTSLTHPDVRVSTPCHVSPSIPKKVLETSREDSLCYRFMKDPHAYDSRCIHHFYRHYFRFLSMYLVAGTVLQEM